MKSIPSIRLLFVSVSLSALLYACPSPSEKPKTDEPVLTDTLSNNEEEATNAVNNLIKTLPSPLHISNMFKRAGLTYKEDIVNTTNQVDNYISKTSKALNMGVYSSDLAYATLNKQTDKSIEYLKTVRELSEQLGMGSIFQSQNMLSRFEKNITNQDSLLFMLHDLAIDSDLLLKETKRLDVVALSFAGAWVESVYISTQIIQKEKNNEIMDRVIEQRISLSQLIPMLGEYGAEDEKIAELVKMLEDLKKEMEAVSTKYPVPTGSDVPDYKGEDISKITDKVASIRSYIVKLA